MIRHILYAPDGSHIYADEYDGSDRLHIVGFGVYRDSIEECQAYVNEHWFDGATNDDGPPYDAATATGMYDWY